MFFLCFLLAYYNPTDSIFLRGGWCVGGVTTAPYTKRSLGTLSNPLAKNRMSKRPRKVAFSDEVQVEDKRRKDEEDEDEKGGERSECALYRISTRSCLCCVVCVVLVIVCN